MSSEAAPAGLYPPRYSMLDAWRGVASLAVVVGHVAGERVPALSKAGLAVQLFFVISGYCLAAAAERARRTGMGPREFFKRRVRRIAPPYLASVALAAALGLFVAGERASGWVYLQNATLTQWVTLTANAWSGRPAPVAYRNSSLLCAPYWSLCYEEQFYLVVTIAVALAALARPVATLAVVTVGCGLVNHARPGWITGLFVDYWLQFACGVALHERLAVARGSSAKLIDLGLAVALAIVATNAAFQGQFHFVTWRYQFVGQLALCLAFTLVLRALRRFDEGLSRTPPLRVLSALGAISYSLYLIHYPILERTQGLRARLAATAGVPAGDALTIAALLACAFVFYRCFERPFLNARWGAKPDV